MRKGLLTTTIIAVLLLGAPAAAQAARHNAPLVATQQSSTCSKVGVYTQGVGVASWTHLSSVFSEGTASYDYALSEPLVEHMMTKSIDVTDCHFTVPLNATITNVAVQWSLYSSGAYSQMFRGSLISAQGARVAQSEDDRLFPFGEKETQRLENPWCDQMAGSQGNGCSPGPWGYWQYKPTPAEVDSEGFGFGLQIVKLVEGFAADGVNNVHLVVGYSVP